MNKEINKKYLKKIEQINKKYLKYNKVGDYDFVNDNEFYHYEFDSLLLKLLNELGYKDIIIKYNQARKYFWYR